MKKISYIVLIAFLISASFLLFCNKNDFTKFESTGATNVDLNNNNRIDGAFIEDVENLQTSGASGTAPVSDGAGGLVMTNIATQSELDSVNSSISTNTANIATNTTNIGTNTSNIGTNTSNISNHINSTNPHTEARGYVYVVDPDESDQGATGSGNTIYAFANDIGTSKSATLLFRHTGDSNTTDYTLDTSVNLSTYSNINLEFENGARLVQNTGDETITIYSPEKMILKQDQQITAVDMIDFALGGVVYAEWWGAKGDESTNDHNALQYSVNSLAASGGTLQLLAKGYKNNSLWTISGHSTVIRGASIGPAPVDFGGGGTWGSKIIGVDGTDCIKFDSVGYAELRDLIVYIPAGATSACIGLTISSSFRPIVKNFRITNFSTGIKLTSTTNPIISEGYVSSTSGTVNPMVGIDIDGTTNQNPSVIINKVVSAHSSFVTSAYGFYIHGDKINDVTISDSEASFVTYGYYIDGSSADAGFAGDINLNSCIADGITDSGFYIASMPISAVVNINAGWAASSAIGVTVASSYGVNVSHVQIYGGTNAIYFNASYGCSANNNIIKFTSQNGILLNASSYCQVTDNFGQQNSSTSSNYINLLAGSQHNVISGNSVHSYDADGWLTGFIQSTTNDYNIIEGNHFPSGTCTTPFTFNLANNTHTLLSDNIGYVNEAGGLSSAISTGGTIAHGLSSTPSIVVIGPTVTGLSNVYWTADGTNITVNYSGGGTNSFYWYAKIK